MFFVEATAGIILANISDHLPYFVSIGNVKAKYIVPKYRHIIQNTDENKKAYMTELTNSGVCDKLNNQKMQIQTFYIICSLASVLNVCRQKKLK